MANETKKNLNEQELNEVAGSYGQIVDSNTGNGEKITKANVVDNFHKDGGKGMINPKYDPRYKDLFNK